MAKKLTIGEQAVGLIYETREGLAEHERRFASLVLALPARSSSPSDIVNQYISTNLHEVMTGDIEKTRTKLVEETQNWLKDTLLWDLFKGIEREYEKVQSEKLYELLKEQKVRAKSTTGKQLLRYQLPQRVEEMELHSEAEGIVTNVNARLGRLSLRQYPYTWNVPVINSETGATQVELEVVDVPDHLPE